MSAEPQAVAEADGSLSLKPFRAALGFGFFNALSWQIALGTPMVLFCERLGASTFEVGLAYAFVFLMTPLQILTTAGVSRFGFKAVMLTGWGLRSLFLLIPLGIAVAAPEEGSRTLVRLLIGSVFFFCLFRSLGVAAWLPWLYTLLPERIRGRYFATDQIVAGVAGAGTLLLCAILFRVLPLYEAFRIEYLVAICGSVLSFISLYRLPSPTPPESLNLAAVLHESPGIVARSGPFRRLLLIGVWFAVTVTPIPPFCAYFLKAGPGFSASHILVLTTLQYAGAISGALLIRSRIDHLGPRPFFRMALTIYALVAVYWLFFLGGQVSGSPGLHGAYFMLGLAASMWFSANLNYLPQVVEPGKRALMVAIHSAGIALSGGLAPIVWGGFLRGTDPVASVDVGVFRIFFAAVIVSVIGLFAFVGRLPRNATWSGERLPGVLAFRPFRAMTNLVGLGESGWAREGAKGKVE
ncbi:MAG: MFS transporter [Opitutaceae bacterium]